MIPISPAQIAANFEAREQGIPLQCRASMLDLGAEELEQAERMAEMHGFGAWGDRRELFVVMEINPAPKRADRPLDQKFVAQRRGLKIVPEGML